MAARGVMRMELTACMSRRAFLRYPAAAVGLALPLAGGLPALVAAAAAGLTVPRW